MSLFRYFTQKPTSTLLFLCVVLFALPSITFAGINGFIYSIATTIGGGILYLAGALFDYAVIELVIEMGEKLSQSGLGGTINDLWTIIRDTFNLLFIFGVIYIGFRVILFSEDSNVHKTLGWLIVAALMVNFSLFITQAVVDFSNATSYQIYTSMINKDLDASNYTGEAKDKEKKVTIGGGFMSLMRMTTFATNDAISSTSTFETRASAGQSAMYGVLVMILMLIAAFVFAAGAFLFLARFVALILFMIFSPAMFVGMIFPFFQKYQKMWWDKFLQYSFVAPAYLFMIYLSFRVLLNIGIAGKTEPELAKAFAAGSFAEGGFMLVLYFFIVAGFMVASLYVANQMGVYGAGASMSMLQWAGKEALGMAGRTFIGNPMRNIDRYLEERGHSSRGVLRSLTRPIANQKFGSSSSAVDMASARKEAERKGARHAQIRNISNAVEQGALAQIALNNPNLHMSDNERANYENQAIAMEEAVAGANTEQLINMLKNTEGTPQYQHIVGAMSDSQTEAVLKKEEEFDDNKRQLLKSVRGTATQERLVASDPDAESIEDVIHKANGKELDAIGFSTAYENAALLSTKQIDEMSLTPTQKNKLQDKRKADLLEVFEESPDSVFDHFNETESAKLPKEILTDPRAASFLSTKILSKIPDNDKITREERQGIKQRVLALYEVGDPRRTDLEGFFRTAAGLNY